MIGNNGSWCYTHWAQRGLVALELSEGYGLSKAAFNSVVPKEWRDPAWQMDVVLLWVIAALTAVLALVCTLWLHQDRAR